MRRFWRSRYRNRFEVIMFQTTLMLRHGYSVCVTYIGSLGLKQVFRQLVFSSGDIFSLQWQPGRAIFYHRPRDRRNSRGTRAVRLRATRPPVTGRLGPWRAKEPSITFTTMRKCVTSNVPLSHYSHLSQKPSKSIRFAGALRGRLVVLGVYNSTPLSCPSTGPTRGGLGQCRGCNHTAPWHVADL